MSGSATPQPTMPQATMKAAVYRRRGAIEISDIGLPVAGPGRALVEVEFCGICGTDLHMVLDGWGAPDTVFGHEWSGRIVDPGGTGLTAGTLVVGLPSAECGECDRCRDGRTSLCRNRPAAGAPAESGAFAQFVGVDAERLVVVPAAVDARAAAYAEPLAVAQHAVTLSGIGPGDRALVSGAGPIGAAVIAILRARGIATSAVEPGPSRAALAQRLGATLRRVDELTVPTHPGETSPDAVAVVFETSGARAAAETALTQLAGGGLLILVGTGLDHPRFDTNRIILNELQVTGAFNYDAHGLRDALDLIASGTLPLDELIADERVALDDLLDAMHRLRAGQIPGKVMVHP